MGKTMYRVREAHGSQYLGWNGHWDQEQFAGEWDERGLKAWVAKQLACERGEPELCYVGDEPNDFTFDGCDAVALIERV